MNKPVKRIFVSAFILFCLAVPVWAELAEIGLCPLELEYGGRPLGMGGGYVGLADDVNSTPYNPAGLAWVKGLTLSVKDITNIGAMQAYPTGNNSSIGLAILSQKNSDIIVPGGTATSSSNIAILSYGTKLNFIPWLYKEETWKRVGIGLNIKGLMAQTLRKTGVPDRSGSGFDLDFGLLIKGTDWWSVGLCAQNFLSPGALGGGSLNWESGTPESFPSAVKFGGSARVIGDIGTPIFMEGRELLLSGDLTLPEGRPLEARFGGEFGFWKTWYLRAGFMQQQNPSGPVADLNFGAGYRTERFGFDVASFRGKNDQRALTFSFLYFPEEWVVLQKLAIEKPKISLERPFEAISLEDNIVTYDDKLEIYGRVKPGVEVFINGLPVYLDKDNNFKTVVPLNLQKNLILVEARAEGEKKGWKYKVLRKAKVTFAPEQKVAQKEKEAVESLVTLGVIEVTPEANFVLESGITRGELATWIVKAADIKLSAVDKDLYADVPKGHPLAPYIKVVAELRLLMPFPDGTFRPQAIVSKEEGDAIFAKLGVKQ